MKAASVSDYRELARRRLPRFLFEYIDGGSYAEVTLRRNTTDLEHMALRQRVMRDVSSIDVSNHGGRQLDGVPSTAHALPAIAAAVGERITVLVDGGVRSGLDVARLLALGARGVLIGRAWAYALAGSGEAGVRHILQLLEAELRVAMALTGCTRVAALTRDCLVSD